MKVLLYEGLEFTLPEMPKFSDIQGYRLPKSDQKWFRTPLPENWDYLSPEEQEAFAEEEDRKSTEGTWFYNNGVPTYITGDHYFYLNWFKIDAGYPQYRDRDRRWFYHWRLCELNDDCIGQCYGKLRRDGYSYRVDSMMLNSARRSFDSNFGIVSKTGEDAREMFKKLVHGFQSLPDFFKPQVQSAEDVKKELVFKTPQQKITYKTRKVKKELSLNTLIDWKATKENAYDGTKQKRLAADETGKWEEANVEKWYNIAKTCVMLGGRIVGKIAFGSTVNESEKGGSNFKAIWDKSNYRELNANGRTVSGLWRYFVPAYDGLEGFIDEYGMSVIDTPEAPVMGIDGSLIKIGAKQYLENERKSKYDAGDIVGYYEEMRQRPFTEEEMFRDPANERTQFDIDKIYQQIDHNVWIKNSIVRGNFVWKDGVRDSEVVWQEDSNGKWLMYWMPKPEDRNKHTMKYNQKAPANTHEGLFGVDPYDHKYTTSNKQSKAASHGLHKLSFNCPEASNAFVTQYWYRPNDPTILYEDMLMQCYFYGWEILGESNKPGCINHFRNRGYENYLMDRPAFTHTEYSKERQKEKWIPNTGDADRGIRRMLVETLQSYIYQNVGINSLTEKMGNCVFDDTLTDWAKFDIDKWTDFDLTVSSMYAVLGASNYTPKKIIGKDPIKLFDVFRVEGASSKLI